MRDYQRTKNNPYRLPHNLYMRVLYLVRDYDRIQAERKDILHGTPAHDGTPVTGFGSPTEAKALRMYTLDLECTAVDRALHAIPPEYRRGVMENICHRVPYPNDAGEATYKRWRGRFLYNVAKNLHLI